MDGKVWFYLTRRPLDGQKPALGHFCGSMAGLIEGDAVWQSIGLSEWARPSLRRLGPDRDDPYAPFPRYAAHAVMESRSQLARRGLVMIDADNRLALTRHLRREQSDAFRIADYHRHIRTRPRHVRVRGGLSAGQSSWFTLTHGVLQFAKATFLLGRLVAKVGSDADDECVVRVDRNFALSQTFAKSEKSGSQLLRRCRRSIVDRPDEGLDAQRRWLGMLVGGEPDGGSDLKLWGDGPVIARQHLAR